MEHPPESLKPFANRVARVVATEGAAQVVRLLRLTGLLGGSPAAPAPEGKPGEVLNPLAQQVNPDEVGIWERKVENGKVCFVRRLDAMPHWQHWANIGRIEAKGPKLRVVLIGESVARGYLYDPKFTPAIALELILEEQLGKGEVEVIDLARTNLSFEVRELALSALQLEPDAVVIFSGNNWWSVSFPGPLEIAEIDEAQPVGGVAEAKRLCEAQIVSNARRVVDDISKVYEEKGVPLVWLVPEFNLGDWRDPITNAPHLPGDRNREWLLLLEAARAAARDGDDARAEESARRMVELDRGTCVTGLYILAECRRRAGDLDAARTYLEMARDATLWDSTRAFAPRPYAVVQETVRRELGKYRGQVIDVPALFKEYLKGELPDRRLFIDYCHLTTEGMQVSMAAAAASVLRALKGVDVPWHALPREHAAPPPEAEAEASFLAAIHNGHWAQSYEIVRHYCARALSYSPHVAGLMLNYMELQAGRVVPMLMSEADEQIYKLGSPLVHHYLFRSNGKQLDTVLLDAMADAMADAMGEAGVEARDRLARLRRELHSVALAETNLLEHYYCTAANQPQEAAWLTERKDRHYAQFYRAYWPESRFVFVGEAGLPVRLCLTCRLPDPAPRETTIAVEFNGRPQAEFDISREWSTWDIDLAGEEVRDGLNELSVRWPLPEFAGTEALERVALNLGERRFPDFYPVFGEIHSFTASRGASVPASAPAGEREPARLEMA
jgi:hypothetical protein